MSRQPDTLEWIADWPYLLPRRLTRPQTVGRYVTATLGAVLAVAWVLPAFVACVLYLAAQGDQEP